MTDFLYQVWLLVGSFLMMGLSLLVVVGVVAAAFGFIWLVGWLDARLQRHRTRRTKPRP